MSRRTDDPTSVRGAASPPHPSEQTAKTAKDAPALES